MYTAETITVPHFSGSSYLAYNTTPEVEYFSSVTMEIRSDAAGDGIVYWNSDGNDFMGIGLVGSRPYFTFDLGTG